MDIASLIKKRKMNTAVKFGFGLTIFLLLSSLAFSKAASAQENYPGYSYLLNADFYKNETVVLRDISVIQSHPSYFPSIGKSYSVEVYAYDGSKIFDGNVDISFDGEMELIPGNYSSSELPERNPFDNVPLLIRIPGFDNATNIMVKHESKTILTIDLSKYICDKNSICELGESNYNCPEDCGPNKSLDSAAKNDVGSQKNYLTLGILALLVLVILAFLILVRRTRM